MKSVKKKGIIALGAVLIVVVLIIYFAQQEWYNTSGWEGDYSIDTYLESGTGSYEYSNETRIYYSYIIESGGMHYELTDEEGEVIYEMDITESCDGYITFENDIAETYYDHEYALNEDTIAHTSGWVQEKRSNFMMFLYRLNRKLDYKLFGTDFMED